MRTVLIFIILVVAFTGVQALLFQKQHTNSVRNPSSQNTKVTTFVSPLSIDAMRQKSYRGSDITVEQTLAPGSNYNRYIVSYLSDGLKQYGLLTVPTESKPSGGWPVILLNHGYIPPAQYSTTDSYAIAVDPLASNSYIVFKPDYRGNAGSEGSPTQVYVSPDYVTDSMNALSSIKKYPDANPAKIGVWGHSMGGNITLHELVMTHDLKAAVLWSGVVGSYRDILSWWDRRVAAHSIAGNDLDTVPFINRLKQEHGTPDTNSDFWNAIDPTHYLSDITTPIQIQVGTGDTQVPPSFSESLNTKLKTLGKQTTLYEYPGADHNLAPDSSQAMAQAVSFFDKYLK